MMGDDDPDDMDAPVGVPEVEEEVRRDDVMEPAAPDAARVVRTVRMTLCVVGTQYQEHGRENSWRVVDRSMVVLRVIRYVIRFEAHRLDPRHTATRARS